LREVINTRGAKTIILSTSPVREGGISICRIFSCCYKDIDDEISVPTIIISRGHYGSVGRGLKEIYGNDVILDGCGKWSGIKVGLDGFSGKELKIRDVTMKRFCPYRNVSGDMVGEMRGGAIYLEGAKFEVGANGVVKMKDAITSRGIGGRVDIRGEGRFNLDSEEKTIIENLNIKDRIEFCLGRGAQLDVGKSMEIEEGAMFNVVNGGVYRITNRLKMYTDVNISKASKYRNIGGNVGIKYLF
jgi:hypothetical protein